MLTDAQRDQLKPLVRTTQTIVGALSFGVLSFLIVVVAIVLSDERGPAERPFLTYITAGGAVFAVAASIFVPMILAGQMRQSSLDAPAGSSDKNAGAAEGETVQQLGQKYQTLLIVKCAILEMSAFFCLVSSLLESHSIGLIVAGILFIILLSQIPTLSRFEGWIEEELVLAKRTRNRR